MAGMLVPVILALAALSPPAVAAPEATADGASSAERRRATLLAVDAWMDAVVLVQLGSTTCAGAVIDPAGTVATAYHCVAPGGRPRLVTREGRRVVGRVTRVDRARDLAIIEAPELAGTAWLEPVDRAPALGTPVVALGHPAGADLPAGFYTGTLRFSASQGIVAAIGPEAVQITAPVNPGNSGGPVVDDRGRLVGVVSRRLAGQSLGFAGRADDIPGLTEPVRAGDTVRFGELEGRVMLTEGHLDGHVSYVFGDVVFCGDTLFAGGCGYLFDGPPATMFDSLLRLASLPGGTRVCCAHEYTQDNLRFALSVEPDNPALVARAEAVERIRAAGGCTLPSTIAEERATNPFLRPGAPTLVQRVGQAMEASLDTPAAVFAATRALKNRGDYKKAP